MSKYFHLNNWVYELSVLERDYISSDNTSTL